MSGQDIPYQLRPNKFIDRQIFVELLSRLVAPRDPETYAYVSMGGRHLVDHHAIYGKLGVQALFSFDMDANEVARQSFNKPIGKAICVEMSSADLPRQIDVMLARFRRIENLIVWLDYTTADRRAQLQEAVETLVRLKHGDVFRITLNANAQTLGAGEKWKTSGAEGPAKYRADCLREQVGEYLPTVVTEINDVSLPGVLADCVRLAAERAQSLQPNLRFVPVLITSYRDGARMVTVTCAVSERSAPESFPNSNFFRWKFACRKWDDMQYIQAPILSSKEQYRLDEYLHLGPRRMLSALKFLPGSDEVSALEAVKSYKSFHRYYPKFRHIED